MHIPIRHYFVAPLGLTLGLLAVSIVIGYRAHSQTPVYRAKKAFIAHLRVLQFGNTQQPPAIQNEVFAIRGDGSHVRRFETISPKGERGWAVDIIDVRNGKYVLLEPFTKSAITFYRSEAEMQNDLRAKLSCNANKETQETIARADSVSDIILKRKVIQVVERHKGSKREATIERWVAPDLDCYSLRKSEWSETGSHNETQVTKVEEVEPPDSMFEIPADFVESSPLQAEAAYSARYPGHSLWGSNAAAVIEERYVKSQGKKRR